MTPDEPRFYTHDLIDVNLDDLDRELADLRAHRGRMVGIVDEEAGGIIAYALGEDAAAQIANALTSKEDR